jgi:hypothetical protein
MIFSDGEKDGEFTNVPKSVGRIPPPCNFPLPEWIESLAWSGGEEEEGGGGGI